MKKLLLILLLVLPMSFIQGQTLTITDPPGLEPPYEVPAGTAVTFTWEYGGTPPTAFYSSEDFPIFPDFGTDESWTVHNNFTNNNDGTYSLTLNISEPFYIWGGSYSSWIMMWSFSNVIEIGVASGVEITAADLNICSGEGDSELLSVNGTYSSYQWYFNNSPISGATSATYAATEAGSYKVQVPLDGNLVFSNTLTLQNPEIEITGSYNGVSLTMTATAGFEQYQWLSGSNSQSLSPVAAQQNQTWTNLVPSGQMYYAVTGLVDGCTVTSSVKEVNAAEFTQPVIQISADTNSYNKVCVGTEVILSTSPNYSSYNWLQNSSESGNNTNSVIITSAYQTGTYEVVVSPADWPEIQIVSDPVDIHYFSPLEPVLNGVENYGSYCAGETIQMVLGDEGYEYDWYVHEDYNYTEEDLVEVAGTVYSFPFEGAVRVTVVANFLGCSSETTVVLNSYESETLFASVQNYHQQYLCTDSTAILQVSNWNISDFENFQWKKLEGTTYVDIPNATDPEYSTSQIGSYVVEATVVACPSVTVSSEPLTIYNYSERELFIYADNEKICYEDTTYLNLASGYEWTAIQWFEGDIEMGANGYEVIYIPMLSGGNTEQQEVTKYNSYLAKAKHISCPNGLKSSSNIVTLKPLVNPVVTPEPNPGVASWNLGAFDSIPFYTFCQGAGLTISTEGEYDSYEYYESGYAGDDDFVLGELVSSTNPADILADGANYYTLLVDSAGCTGMSTPLLIDTYVFQSPAITSYNNAELCGPGDSTLLHIAFPGDWSYFEWFLNGSLLGNSNNDSIYASVAGEYTVTAYPTLCPDVGFSSGVGPVVTFLNATIEEDEDLIYAMPELGFYEYQWYFNGEPIPGSNIPWILYKDDMPAGIYTVEVTNPGGCTSMSDPFNWNPTGISQRTASRAIVSPNPTRGLISITNTAAGDLDTYHLIDMQGKTVLKGTFGNTATIDAASVQAGRYILQIRYLSGILQHLNVVLE